MINWFKKFLHDELGYSLNNPVNYIDKTGNKEYLDRIDTDFSTWEKVHNQKLMLKANMFGFAFELRYLKDTEFKATVLTPMNCFVLEGNDADKTVQLGMHFYKESIFSEKEKVDVYLPNNKVIHYDLDGNKLIPNGEGEHVFPYVPIHVVEANTERSSMLDDIKDPVDNYNVTISNMVNELSDFRLAILKIIGTKFENEDDISKMVEKGAIELQTGAQIDYLMKNLPDAFANSTLREIKENIFRLASHIDTAEKLSSNTSGDALRGRLITLENKCTTIQSMLEQCIKSRLRDYFYILKVREDIDYDYRFFKQKFTMNVPQELTSLADVASKFKDILPLETIYGLMPFVENPQMEYKKFIKQQKELMGFEDDLDAIENEETVPQKETVPIEDADNVE